MVIVSTQKNIKVVGFKPRRIIWILGTKFHCWGALSMSWRRVIPFEHVLFHVGFSVYQPCATIAFHFILYSMWSRSKKVPQASGNSRWLCFRNCSYSRVVQVVQKHQGTHLGHMFRIDLVSKNLPANFFCNCRKKK